MEIKLTQNRFKKAIFVVCMSLIGLGTIVAQTLTITGKISSDQDGVGIPGASISLKGTSKGTFSSLHL
jgi:hypothetical protein